MSTPDTNQKFEVEVYLKPGEQIENARKELYRIDESCEQLIVYGNDDHKDHLKVVSLPKTELANIIFLSSEDQTKILALRKSIFKLLMAGLNSSKLEIEREITRLIKDAAQKYKNKLISDILGHSGVMYLDIGDYNTWKKWLSRGFIFSEQHRSFYLDQNDILSNKIGYLDHDEKSSRGYKLVPPEAILDLIIEARKVFERFEIRAMDISNGEQAFFVLYADKIYILGRWIKLDQNNAGNLIKSDQHLQPFEKIKRLTNRSDWISPKPRQTELPDSAKVSFWQSLKRLLPT